MIKYESFSGETVEVQLRLMGAGDTIACGERLARSAEDAHYHHTQRGLYDPDEAAWLGHAGAASVAAPAFHK